MKIEIQPKQVVLEEDSKIESEQWLGKARLSAMDSSSCEDASARESPQPIQERYFPRYSTQESVSYQRVGGGNMETKVVKKSPIIEKTTIIVMDIQNDFCSSESFPVKTWGHNVSHIEKMVEKMKRFLGKAYLMGVDIIYTKTIYDPKKVLPSFRTKSLEILGRFVAPNTWGSDFYKLRPPKDKVFVKYCFSAFTNQNLLNYLRENKIENLILIGVDSNICVESTARAAFDLGFNVTLVRDLVGTPTFMQNHEKEFLLTFQIIFGEVVSSEEILTSWNGLNERDIDERK